MKVFRIVKQKYASDLSGEGAKIFGGRWNPIGTAALYTSESRALAVLELLAHLPKEIIPPNYVIITIEIPQKLENQIVSITKLPKDWNSLSPIETTQEIGLNYFERQNILGFYVPSAIIELERNIVLNPKHKDYENLKVTNKNIFIFDKRILNLPRPKALE